MLRASQLFLAMLSLFVACSYGCASSESTLPPPPPDISAPDMNTTGPVPVVADGVRSGERLKVGYFQAGNTQFPGALIDEQIGELLVEPRLAADGKTRALPRFTDASTGYFIDAACTLPLYARQPDVAAPVYMTVQEASGAHVYRAGALATPTQVYYLVGGACMSRGLPGGLAGLQYFGAGEQVELGDFAELSIARGQ